MAVLYLGQFLSVAQPFIFTAVSVTLCWGHGTLKVSVKGEKISTLGPGQVVGLQLDVVQMTWTNLGHFGKTKKKRNMLNHKKPELILNMMMKHVETMFFVLLKMIESQYRPNIFHEIRNTRIKIGCNSGVNLSAFA